MGITRTYTTTAVVGIAQSVAVERGTVAELMASLLRNEAFFTRHMRVMPQGECENVRTAYGACAGVIVSITLGDITTRTLYLTNAHGQFFFLAYITQYV